MARQDLILKIMGTLFAAYPSAQRSDEDLRLLKLLWIDVLEDVPDASLQAAAREYTRSAATFAPAPGQLRTRAIELSHEDIAALAEKAWQGVMDCGFGREPQYIVDATLTNEIMRRLGGYNRLGDTSPEWVNKNFREPFLKMYAELKQRELSGAPLLTAGAQADKLIADTASKLKLKAG